MRSSKVPAQGARADPAAGSGGSDAPGPDWTITTLLDRLRDRGDATVLTAMRDSEARTLSARQLVDEAERLASGMIHAGLRPQEIVAIIGPNGPEWLVACIGAAAAGSLILPLDDLSTDTEIAEALARFRPHLVFASPGHAAAVSRAFDGNRGLYLLSDGKAGEIGAPVWRELFAEKAGELPRLGPDDPLLQFQTSGTTGAPKRFILSNGNAAANIVALLEQGAIGPDDRVLLPLPLHHVYPLFIGAFTTLSAGAMVVLPESVTARDLVQALQTTRPTIIVGVPRLYEALLDGLKTRVRARGRLAMALFKSLLSASIWLRRRLGIRWFGRILLSPIRRQLGGKLRQLVSGGARLEDGTAWQLAGLGFEVRSGYGLAETASVFTGNTPNETRLDSQGKPFGIGEMRIAEPGADGVGEIQLRGPSVFAGYQDNDEANRLAFTEDNWFRTGDLGRIAEDGFLDVVGRANELIVLGGGKKLFPEELEKRYAASPYIKEIGIFERGGMLVGAVVPDMEAMQETAIGNPQGWIRVELSSTASQLPSHMRLAGSAIVRQPLPRTRLGKLRRFMLPQIYEAALRPPGPEGSTELSASDQAFLRMPDHKKIWTILRGRYGAREFTLDDNPALDLGIDSLEAMGLVLEIEQRTGSALSEEDVLTAGTVRELIESAVARDAGGAAGRRREETTNVQRWLEPPGWPTRVLGAFLTLCIRALVMVLFRLRVRGREHLPKSGPLVITPNHASDLDPLVVAAALPFGHIRRARWSGDVDRLFSSRFRRLISRSLGVFPVDQKRPAECVATARTVLDQGETLLWFPEHWRSPSGEVEEFLPGIGMLLERTEINVLPMLIEGTFDIWPRHRRWPRLFQKIRVTIGQPVRADTLDVENGEGDRPHRIAGELRRRVQALADD